MEIKKKVTEEIELTWPQVVKILKKHFESEGFKATNINYNLENHYDGYDDHYGTMKISKITITRETNESIITNSSKE